MRRCSSVRLRGGAAELIAKRRGVKARTNARQQKIRKNAGKQLTENRERTGLSPAEMFERLLFFSSAGRSWPLGWFSLCERCPDLLLPPNVAALRTLREDRPCPASATFIAARPSSLPGTAFVDSDRDGARPGLRAPSLF